MFDIKPFENVLQNLNSFQASFGIATEIIDIFSIIDNLQTKNSFPYERELICYKRVNNKTSSQTSNFYSQKCIDISSTIDDSHTLNTLLKSSYNYGREFCELLEVQLAFEGLLHCQSKI